ncbi:MAG: hypothetical protein BWY63_02960 [Chloroflexi bacterium ADurb.Bin360]|nr:MAG: hypothetical protein BWY63_02960 [Chloroflexi bacterium ADurb.Bin360]
MAYEVQISDPKGGEPKTITFSYYINVWRCMQDLGNCSDVWGLNFEIQDTIAELIC